ncbi:MAG: hypothetical protein GX817_04505, partial [Elusimicrobia bacterium]|nr:hypothetical protein [Elusimicrobiota bacterium]
IGYMSLAPLTGLFYYSLLQRRRKLFNFYAAFHLVLLLIVAGTAILQTKTGFIMNEPLAETSIPEKTRLRDLTAEISGWDQVGTYLSELDMEEKFLFTHRWELGGYITHGLRGEYPLICLGNLNRARGYAFWQDQDEFIGQDGIFISSARYFADPLELYQDYFEDIEYLGELPLIRQGIKVKKIYFYLARNFSGGFPVFGI